MITTVLLLVNFPNIRSPIWKSVCPDINFASVTHRKCKGHTGPGGLRHPRPHDANVAIHFMSNKKNLKFYEN